MPTQERTSPCFVSVEDLNRESAPGYQSTEVHRVPNGTRVVVDENFNPTTILPDGTIVRNRPDTGMPLPPHMEDEEHQHPNPVDEGSTEVHALPRRSRGMFGQQEPEVGIVVETTENDAFENLILYPEVVSDIKDGLRQIQMRDQLEAVWGISRIYPMSGRVVLSMWGNSGCHAKGTKVIMFDGSIKNVEDVRVGDSLMGPDSKAREVLELCRGKETMARVNPLRGGDPFVCNINHILSLRRTGTAVNNPFGDAIFNIKIADFLKFTNPQQRMFKLWRPAMVHFKEQNLLIDPYILGLWLGDGDSRDPVITTMDKEIKDAWTDFLAKNGCECRISTDMRGNKSKRYSATMGQTGGAKNPVRELFKKYNLLDNKHIPIQYLTSSKEQRMSLLAGIIDTDGHASNGTGFDLILKNKALADGVVYLAKSLGMLTSIRKVKKYCQYKGQTRTGEYHRIFIGVSPEMIPDIPTRLVRKKLNSYNTPHLSRLVSGFTIDILPEDNYYGFVLNGDHLYLLGDFTVTHNTGKTRCARAVARMLGKKLYQVDYAQVVSKYLGDTAKHIKQAFTRARQLDAVLFWDEADSLMSRRVDMGESCATSINQNRNTLMQELDRFQNPVLMTTNLFGNYDDAFIRRIAKHIEFKLPNKEMRKEIFKKHIPDLNRVDADLDLVAAASDTLAGGDIFNICLNVILASSVDADTNNWRMKQETFLAEIQKVKNARTANATSRASRVARPAAGT
jgi:hypothetical protein